MRRCRHTPAQIVRKLREVARPLGAGHTSHHDRFALNRARYPR